MQKTNPGEVPVVRLRSGGFNHRDDRIGWVATPVFAVVGRAPRDSAKSDTTAAADSRRRNSVLRGRAMDQINPWDRKHWSGNTARMRKFHDRIEGDIERYGRFVVCVAATEDSGPTDDPNDYFSYTIGVFRQGYILNPLSEMMIERGHKFADGELVDLGGSFPVCLIDAAETVKDDYTIQAGEHYDSSDYAVMQVVMSDPCGLFPWQPKCAAPHSRIAVHRRAAA
jgi:Domain of unknown function (DUF4262)